MYKVVKMQNAEISRELSSSTAGVLLEKMHRKLKNSCAIVFTGCFLFIHHLMLGHILFEGVMLKQVNFGVVGHGFD